MGLMKVLNDTMIKQQKNMEMMAQAINTLMQQLDGHHGEVMKKLEEVVEEEVVEEHNSPFIPNIELLFLLKEQEPLLAFLSFIFFFFSFVLQWNKRYKYDDYCHVCVRL